jgi:hypothetical protein
MHERNGDTLRKAVEQLSLLDQLYGELRLSQPRRVTIDYYALCVLGISRIQLEYKKRSAVRGK